MGIHVEEVDNTTGSSVVIREVGTQVLKQNDGPVPLLHVQVRPFDGFSIEEALFLRVVRKWLQARDMVIVPLEQLHISAHPKEPVQ